MEVADGLGLTIGGCYDNEALLACVDCLEYLVP